MEAASVPAPEQSPDPFDVSAVHEHLSAAEQAFHDLFEGHVPDELRRFAAHLSTVRMVVDQSADSASKE